MWRISALLLITLISISAISKPANAQIEVNTFIIDFLSDGPLRRDFQIRNTSSETQYISIQPFRITKPGLEGSERLPLRDPRKFGMLVSPARMVLAPGAIKSVRIVLLEPPGEKERIYRVTVKPVFGKIRSNQNAIKVAFGYDMLVIVRSANGEPKIISKRTGKKLILKNEGIASVYISGGRQCKSGNKDCIKVAGTRLYEGNEWTIELPRAAPVEFIEFHGNSSRAVVY